MTDDLVMCSCGLAKYAIDTPDGWRFVCQDCDGPVLLHPPLADDPTTQSDEPGGAS